MSALTFVNPAGLYDPTQHGYSHLAIAPAGVRLLFLAGQGGLRADGSLPDSFAEQVRQAITNLELALAGGGATLADVARTTLLVVGLDADRFAALGVELARAWPDAKPASTLIPVPGLALPGMVFEIEATAVTR